MLVPVQRGEEQVKNGERDQSSVTKREMHRAIHISLNCMHSAEVRKPWDLHLWEEQGEEESVNAPHQEQAPEAAVRPSCCDKRVRRMNKDMSRTFGFCSDVVVVLRRRSESAKRKQKKQHAPTKVRLSIDYRTSIVKARSCCAGVNTLPAAAR